MTAQVSMAVPAGSPAAVESSAEPESRRARVYGSVRTAHLERFRTMAPAVVLHRHRRYDFDATLAAELPAVHQVGRLATVGHLLVHRYDAVELNEPLMAGRWADVAAQLAAVRLRSTVGRGRTVVGAYCIGLTDPVTRLGLEHGLPEPVARWWSRLVIGRLVRGMDRLAFGTTASYDLLARYVDADVLAARARIFPAVAAPCACAAEAPRDAHTVLFVGAFTDRKGIRQLLAAWEVLADDGLRLRILGKGPLEDEVAAWAAGRSEVELVIDPPRADIHAALAGAHVLVLLSQRVGAWREQVGLPIVEGLSHGCEIVTTDETGLAAWLGEHQHHVVPADASSERIAAALRAAAAATRTADAIRADLPKADPRAAADDWLLTPAGLPRSEADAALPHGDDAPPAPPAAATRKLYVAAAKRSLRRHGIDPRELVTRWDDRPVFVVGSPRSGTSFTAETIGAVPGFADLGELRPLKAAIPWLTGLPRDEAAARIRTTVRRAQRLGLVSSRRGIEQTPESTYLIEAIAEAFPEARFVHMVRDGRDVASSLIGLGWLRDVPDHEADEVGAALGDHARFWVEPERRAEFSRASEATRAAWVWRRYESTARRLLEPLAGRAIEVRYERLISTPEEVARELAGFLDDEAHADEFAAAFGSTRSTAAGRWRTDLGAAQLADVRAEAGELLDRLGYID